MNLFDDTDDILHDSESTIQSEIIDEQNSKLFIKWFDKIKDTRQEYKTNRYHNLIGMVDDIDTLSFTFGSKAYPNIILMPYTFITESPRIVDFLNLESTVGDDPDIRLILYSPRTWGDFVIEEKVITSEDIDVLSLIKIPENNIGHLSEILFRGTFDTFDTYYKFLEVFSKYKIWIHYETKILHPGITVKDTSIPELLMNDKLDKDLITKNNTVKISYQSFYNDGII